MPFPIVWGIPNDTPKEVLEVLRWNIVAALAETGLSPAHWIRPFFPADLLGAPRDNADGCRTIFVELATAMFFGKEDADAKATRATKALAQTVWRAFSGQYEVEVFVGDLNPAWRFLIKAKG